MNNDLRNKVKLAKAYNGISYKSIALQLGIKQKSFYNWLHNEYEFSLNTERKLLDILQQLDTV